VILQAHFHPRETINAGSSSIRDNTTRGRFIVIISEHTVEQLVRECLSNEQKHQKFNLFVSPPLQVRDHDDT
jgi:hypothetical protein